MTSPTALAVEGRRPSGAQSARGVQGGESSIPQVTFDYLASLEWIRATENLCLVDPAGTGKSHLLVGVGHAAVAAGMRVRYFVAADLVATIYRGIADNSGASSSTPCCAET